MLKIKSKNPFAQYIILIAMGALVLKSSDVLAAVRESLRLCFSSVIPALFPFMVLSSAFVSTVSDSSFKLMSKLTARIFGISPCGTAAFICGMVCGYPIGAKCTAELYKEKKITASEAESLIAYSNNSGPLFVIGAVGAGIFGSLQGGIILYIIQVFSALTAAMLLKKHTTRRIIITHNSKKSTGDLTSAICAGVTSILSVCGFIVFFAVVNTLIAPLTSMLAPTAESIVSFVIEITNGINTVNESTQSLKHKLILASIALGWSGFSVHMQVKSILKGTGLSMKKYYITRGFMSLYSGIIAYLILNFRDDIVITLCNGRSLIWVLPIGLCVAVLVIALKKERKPSVSENLPSRVLNLKYKH